MEKTPQSSVQGRDGMNDFFKWVLKVAAIGVLWVFILSIRWDGKMMFSYAHETLVQNSLVQAADQELADIWYRMSKTASVTFSKSQPEDNKEM
jgi:hypothetical protein